MAFTGSSAIDIDKIFDGQYISQHHGVMSD